MIVPFVSAAASGLAGVMPSTSLKPPVPLFPLSWTRTVYTPVFSSLTSTLPVEKKVCTSSPSGSNRCATASKFAVRDAAHAQRDRAVLGALKRPVVDAADGGDIAGDDAAIKEGYR